MEFIRKTNLDGLPSRIEFNYEELKAEISQSLEKYNDKSSTDYTNYKERKSDRARLNVLARALNTEKANIKKILLAPLDNVGSDGLSFTQKVDELVGSIKTTIDEIDSGIKSHEESMREEKRQDILEYLTSHVNMVFESNPTLCKSGHFMRWAESQMSRRQNSWLNATYPNQFIRNEICKEVARCSEAAKVVDTLVVADDEIARIKALDALAIDFNVEHMISIVHTHKEQVKAIERAKQLAKQKQVEELANKVVANTSVKTNTTQQAEPLYSCTMRFVGTMNAFSNLKEYLSMNRDIQFAVVHSMEEINK